MERCLWLVAIRVDVVTGMRKCRISNAKGGIHTQDACTVPYLMRALNAHQRGNFRRAGKYIPDFRGRVCMLEISGVCFNEALNEINLLKCVMYDFAVYLIGVIR